jgi:4-hydroxy-2-oxoheptanedioate aldolase
VNPSESRITHSKLGRGILSVEGLDAVYVGPSDLSLSLGCRPSFDDVEPKVAQAIDHVVERARAHGIVAGIHNGRPAAARTRIAKGYRFVTVGSDARTLASGSQELLSALRG